ncbi:MAG: RNA repair transcriptional activator RtcR family protein, partial [Myxococcota bacterium]
MKRASTTVVGFLGTTLDRGSSARRWARWRPTVAIAGHDDLEVDRLLLLDTAGESFVATVVADIER